MSNHLSTAPVDVVSAEEARALQSAGALLVDTREYAPATAAGAAKVKAESARPAGEGPHPEEEDGVDISHAEKVYYLPSR